MTKIQARVLSPNRKQMEFRANDLEGYLEAARAEVARLKAELEADPAAVERARDAARRRAAHEREAPGETLGVPARV